MSTVIYVAKCRLSQRGVFQLCCTCSLHPSQHPVAAVALKTTMKETSCIILDGCSFLLFPINSAFYFIQCEIGYF